MKYKDFIQLRFPALASRDYSIFWVGQFLSLIGTWMQSTTQPYLAYHISGSPLDLGLIGMAATLPTFFLALPGGVLVERFDKRKTVIAMQAIMMFQALSLALLTFTGVIQIWHIILLSFLLGVASAVEITARQAMLVELVGKEALPNAIALQATIFNAARIIGPSLMAPFMIFIQGNGEAWAFLANGISYLVVIAGLFFVRTPFKETKEFAKLNLISDMKESFDFIRKTQTVSMIILMATVFGFLGFPLLQQIPVFGRDVLKLAGDTESDIATRTSLLFTFMGVGALVSALSIAAYNPKPKGKILVLGQAIFSLAIVGLAFSKWLPLSLGIFLLVGLGMVGTLATMNTLIQLEAPNEMRGRVFSFYLWGLQGVSPFGSLLIGWMASVLGILNTTLICGVACLFFMLWIHITTPSIRQIRA